MRTAIETMRAQTEFPETLPENLDGVPTSGLILMIREFEKITQELDPEIYEDLCRSIPMEAYVQRLRVLVERRMRPIPEADGAAEPLLRNVQE